MMLTPAVLPSMQNLVCYCTQAAAGISHTDRSHGPDHHDRQAPLEEDCAVEA